MDSSVITMTIIVFILIGLVPCAVLILRKYMTSDALHDDPTNDTERLYILVDSILDRDVSFDVQRKTVKELALSYREIKNKREQEKLENNVIQFFDRRSTEDKIRKI
jgi:hypothetical protein